jgi:hypothetical protein
MDERLCPRLLRWILPADFVRRVAEPAYDDLLASGMERGKPVVGLAAMVGFVIECLWTAFLHAIFLRRFSLRRSRVLAVVLLLVALAIVRERVAYSGAYSSRPQRLKASPKE